MTTATIRPSSLGRIVACPGSLMAAAGAPAWHDAYSDNTAREEGTACHQLAEHTLNGEPLEVADNGVVIDDAMRAAVALYIGHLNTINACPEIELPLEIPQLGDCRGTADAVAFEGTHIHIVDLKYGFRQVEVWPNYQLIAYALGAAYHRGIGWRQTTYTLTIVQPRGYHRGGPIRSVTVTGEELAQHVDAITTAIGNARSEKPTYSAGPQCGHCPARARCPTLRSVAMYDVVTDPYDLTLEQAETELQYLQSIVELQQCYIEGLKSQVEHAIRNGTPSRYYSLESTPGRREWLPGAAKKIEVLAELEGVNVTKPKEIITPTQAKKVLGEIIVNQFSHQKPSPLKLVKFDATKYFPK